MHGMVIESVNCRLHVSGENIKMLRVRCQDTDKNAYINNEPFSCLPLHLSKQKHKKKKKRPNNSLHFSSVMNKLQSDILSFLLPTVFQVFLLSLDFNANKSGDPFFCDLFPDLYCVHLLSPASHIVCKLPCSVNVQSLDL